MILRKLVAKMLKVPRVVHYPLILMILFLPGLTYVNNRKNLRFQSWPGALTVRRTPQFPAPSVTSLKYVNLTLSKSVILPKFLELMEYGLILTWLSLQQVVKYISIPLSNTEQAHHAYYY